MKITVRRAPPAGDTLVITYFAKERPAAHPFWKLLRSAERAQVERLFKSREITGKAGEAKVLLRNSRGKLVILGLGEKKNWNQRKLILATRRMVMLAKAERAPSCVVALQPLLHQQMTFEIAAHLAAENFVMANYEFHTYRSNAKHRFFMRQVSLVGPAEKLAEIARGAKAGTVVGEAVNSARDLGNTPGGDMTPTSLATKARELVKGLPVKVQIFGKREMEKFKMGAILGVARGSAEEPKFIVMEYYGGPKKEAPYVFVGKGVTFDTGGLNLKPESSMSDMHLDMSGGAAVVNAVAAAARLKLSVNLVGLVPAVENMPGSAGYRPGDLLRSMSGKTIEVLNTDAEGRIILADALTFAERYQPKLVIDVATLTGACMVALGLRCSGLMTPDASLQQELVNVGEKSGDYVWPLPMWEEYEEDVQGTFGDVANLGKNRYGGAIAGAMFLKQFAGAYPWAHLDIAGPMKTIDGENLAKGASGVGVRFLLGLLFARLRLG